MNLSRGLELVREKIHRNSPIGAPRDHLDAAIAWLYAAQDSSEDHGVSHSYLVGRGWMLSYPETTGYIVPTLLNWSRFSGDAEGKDRALGMADWELEVQLEDGSIPDLRDGRGVVFDTGQVIFGWVAAYHASGKDQYLEAARRAAEWLLRSRDKSGVWRFANDAGGPGRVYNARVTWSLLELTAATEDREMADAARIFLDWTLVQEHGDGWFGSNCLTDDSAPLLHTIAYTARGHLESGFHLGEQRYVDAARRTASVVASRVREDGYLAGRFDHRWDPAVSWSCLTGMAQMCVVWSRLSAELERTGSAAAEVASYRVAVQKVIRFLMLTQDRRSSNPGLRGGIRGSHPINGAYCPWRVLNWATKFFVDALLIDEDPNALDYAG